MTAQTAEIRFLHKHVKVKQCCVKTFFFRKIKLIFNLPRKIGFENQTLDFL